MRSKINLTLIVFLLVFSLNLVLSVESDITSEFEIGGCTTPSGEGLSLNACSADGNYYCNQGGEVENTITTEDACSDGSSICCPSGRDCENDGSGNFYCVQRETPCSDNQDVSSCELANCFWIEPSPSSPESFCADRPSDYSCSVYTSPTECQNDFLNLGRIGFGTEICGQDFVDGNGKIFVAPAKNCRCIWQNLAGGICKLKYDVTPDIYAFGNPNFDRFSCQKEFTSAFCIDGEQKVNWTAAVVDIQGFLFGSPDDTLIANSKCKDGEHTRTCGETIIRLPAMSTFAMISSSVIIGLFYFLKREEFE